VTAPSEQAAQPSAGRGIGERIFSTIAIPVISIILALLVGAVVMILSSALVPGHSFDLGLPIQAYAALFEGAFGSVAAWINTLYYTAPLLLAGLGVAIGFKAGLFNIGARGQFVIGALGAAAVATVVHDSAPIIAIPLTVLGGIAAGAVWGGIVGVLKAYSGAHEVVTTIMMNYIAFAVLSWAVSGPLRQPGSPQPVTPDVGNAAFPILFGDNGHLGILIAAAMVPIVWFVLYRTTRGFEIRTLGANLDAARYAGMRPRSLTILVMGIAGGLAGLAGTGNLLGFNHHIPASFDTTVGFDSITVALLGRSNPFGVALAALFFGGMRASAGDMQVQAGLPTELVDVIEAVLLFFLVVGPILGARLRLRGVQTGLGDANRVSAALGSEVAH